MKDFAGNAFTLANKSATKWAKSFTLLKGTAKDSSRVNNTKCGVILECQKAARD